ncbi:MAG TPA: protein-L-isoaspartate O-methyltransferase [Devosiaceae bacterium]|nr:protein-L-isoaspartate O-methyltransferase [Devosiaceae bacterium]
MGHHPAASPGISRRRFLGGGLAAAALLPLWARTAIADPIGSPPTKSAQAFSDWMLARRPEDPGMLRQRFSTLKQLVARHDIWNAANSRAFLLTPREAFVAPETRDDAYALHLLDLGYGVTVTPPQTVSHMTSALDVRPGEKVLEVGTGSGYQSAYLSNLTSQVWTIEIIAPLFARTGEVFSRLIAEGYDEYRAIGRRQGDGYYGWPEAAPFDRIIVTCGIDHIPPPLLQQLVPNGTMVIPVGPPGAQHILKVVKRQQADGSFTVTRSDINNGLVVPFVPFTKLVQGRVVGTHDG